MIIVILKSKSSAKEGGWKNVHCAPSILPTCNDYLFPKIWRLVALLESQDDSTAAVCYAALIFKHSAGIILCHTRNYIRCHTRNYFFCHTKNQILCYSRNYFLCHTMNYILCHQRNYILCHVRKSHVPLPTCFSRTPSIQGTTYCWYRELKVSLKIESQT